MNGSRKTVGIVRELDSLGRIVIPKETRNLLGIRVEDAIAFSLLDHTIVIRRHHSDCCFFCASTVEIVPFKNYHVCSQCLNESASRIREEPTIKSKQDKLRCLQSILENNPALKQREAAEIMGVSQGYISQLMKLLQQTETK